MIGVTLENMIGIIMEAEIIAYMLQAATPEDDYLLMPVNDAGIGEPLFQGGPFLPEDPIPTVPLQEIPPHEAEVDVDNNDMDPVDFLLLQRTTSKILQ